MSWTVYKHTNKTNGKVYIGITQIAPEDRWRNGEGYYLQKYFYNAIKKYGWDGFTHEILYSNLSAEEAEEKEKELIALYKSNYKRYQSPSYGYNATDGGEGRVGYGIPVNQYDLYGHFIQTWFSATEASLSLECSRSSIVYACQGVAFRAGDYMWRYFHEYSDCIDIDSYYAITGFIDPLEVLREKEMRQKEEAEWRKVIQYSLYGERIREWSGLTEASQFYNTSISHLHSVCIGKNKSACGYIWRFSHPERQPDSFPKYTRILQYKDNQLIGTYLSTREAEDKTGVGSSQISKCYRGLRKHAGGYQWKKIEVEIK